MGLAFMAMRHVVNEYVFTREEEEIKLFGDGVPTYEMVGWCSEVIFLLSLYSPKGGVMVICQKKKKSRSHGRRVFAS